MHDRLRKELLRRIERGTLSVSLLARQTGFGQSHLSNYLHNRRQLSLEAVDRVLAAQHLTAADLLPVLQHPGPHGADAEGSTVPVVSHHAALFEPYIRPASATGMMHLPLGFLDFMPTRAPNPCRAWERFVAIRVSASDAQPMEPLVLADALALLDRHYNTLIPYRPNRANLFAVRDGAHLKLRYVDFIAHRMVLRPHNLTFPVDLIEVDPNESPGDLIAGRVALILNET
jgi:hypothetical protein